MLASEKRKIEQNEIKQSRMNHILECAYDLFDNGIDVITMNDIAKKAEIGVASLYRYFSTKNILAIECARYFWKKEETKMMDILSWSDFNNIDGFNQVKILLSMFPKFFATEKKFFRYIYYFDAFTKTENISANDLNPYELIIQGSKNVMMSAIVKGANDGSIEFHGASTDELYFTLTHSFFSLAQKLSLTSEMLTMDSAISSQIQMDLLAKLLLCSISKNREN